MSGCLSRVHFNLLQHTAAHEHTGEAQDDLLCTRKRLQSVYGVEVQCGHVQVLVTYHGDQCQSNRIHQITPPKMKGDSKSLPIDSLYYTAHLTNSNTSVRMESTALLH